MMDAVETMLRDHPNVRAVTMFRTSTREPALRVAAVVPEPVSASADIRDHLGAALEPTLLPDVLLGVSDLPHGADGAVDTVRIERELLDQPGRGYTFQAPHTLREFGCDFGRNPQAHENAYAISPVGDCCGRSTGHLW